MPPRGLKGCHNHVGGLLFFFLPFLFLHSTASSLLGVFSLYTNYYFFCSFSFPYSILSSPAACSPQPMGSHSSSYLLVQEACLFRSFLILYATTCIVLFWMTFLWCTVHCTFFPSIRSCSHNFLLQTRKKKKSSPLLQFRGKKCQHYDILKFVFSLPFFHFSFYHTFFTLLLFYSISFPCFRSCL
ncbi:hypothetical protein B9Z19DRAFT_409245 [Tuber borchii]|uniref:Uncharacterized protein n=1 Tax=Tuber borchii TaxID=42251 RepID=A0A2T6ZH63_TUBBO|nr:hypothetical protein B9Z19DRAFT_409245 [Tuber borchii]